MIVDLRPAKQNHYYKNSAADRCGICGGDYDGHLTYNRNTEQTMKHLDLKNSGYIYTANFSPDGKRIVTASYDKTARVWDAATGKPLSPPLEHKAIVESAAFGPDGTKIITCCCGKVYIWSLKKTTKQVVTNIETEEWVCE